MKINIPTSKASVSSIRDTISVFTNDKEIALNCLRLIQASISVLPKVKIMSDITSMYINFDVALLQQKNTSKLGPLVFFENTLRKLLSELGGGYVVRRSVDNIEHYALTYKNLKIHASCINNKIMPVIKVSL